jgi:hypothetical protein
VCNVATYGDNVAAIGGRWRYFWWAAVLPSLVTVLQEWGGGTPSRTIGVNTLSVVGGGAASWSQHGAVGAAIDGRLCYSEQATLLLSMGGVATSGGQWCYFQWAVRLQGWTEALPGLADGGDWAQECCQLCWWTGQT